MSPSDSIAGQITNGALLSDALFGSLDFDSALERRDMEVFEERWIQAAREIDSIWTSRSDLRICTPSVDRVRELAFKRTFAATGGHHDMAASISDDFELICKMRIAAVDVPFVAELEAAYLAHRFPRDPKA